jgi:metal-responsive CopG/Arc/MetJ family transcriptional regulator
MAINKEKNTQILVTFPNDIVDKIDEYWHENKIKNRNETIRQLIKKGLESE